MPLRDHFPPPFDRYGCWQGLFGQWPGVIVQHLRDALPPGYRAGPIIRIATDPPLHEVRLYDIRHGRRLVAVIELVSPLNKDTPAKGDAFVHRCADLLECGVAVSVVDVVTAYSFDLFAELMTFLTYAEPPSTDGPPPLYVASCLWRGHTLESWSHALAVGQPLPTLPLWLADDLAVPLDLEASYEETCATFGV